MHVPSCHSPTFLLLRCRISFAFQLWVGRHRESLMRGDNWPLLSPVGSRHFIQGWSLPHDVAQQSLSDMDFIQSIPAPIYCGPLGSLDNERKSLVSLYLHFFDHPVYNIAKNHILNGFWNLAPLNVEIKFLLKTPSGEVLCHCKRGWSTYYPLHDLGMLHHILRFVMSHHTN